jgi:hypothetical protein
VKRERRMNPKCLGSMLPDTFIAKSADSTGLKMIRITRAGSFEYLVGEGHQIVREFHPERLGCLEVDHELELGRLHDRQISGLGALQNSAGINANLAIHFGKIDAIAHQAAGHGIVAKRIHRGHRMTRPA